MIDQKNMVQQMMGLNKAAVDGFRGFFQFQEQAEEQIKALYDNVPYFPDAYKKAMADYIVWHKDLHVQFISMMEDNLKKVESSLSV